MLLALALAAAFHVQLDSNAASSFPLMRRFGEILVDVYPRGFRVTTIWLRAFAINGEGTITIENPLTRTYTKNPMSAVGDTVRLVSPRKLSVGAPRGLQVSSGTVGKLPARRYRLLYEGRDFIDVWTTSALGPTPALRSCIDEIVRAAAPAAAPVIRRIPDTPLYVELNIGPYRKVALLKTKSVVHNSTGEREALRVSPWMIQAPFDAIFK